MRDKNLFHLLLGLNVALALAFVVYLIVSNSRDPQVETASFDPSSSAPVSSSPASNDIASQLAQLSRTNNARAASDPAADTTSSVASVTNQVAPPQPEPAEPTFRSQAVNWQHLDSEIYEKYVESLRAIGCPEEKVRYIILSDIDDYVAQQRLEVAVANDHQWWSEQQDRTLDLKLREQGAALEKTRTELIRKWLGPEAAEEAQGDMNFWNHVQLTGPVLGALDNETHRVVQEICAESIDRFQSISWAGINAGRSMNKVDLAQLRERTRSELNKVLDPEEVEEFLLRYSHNANNLRNDLRGFNPTSEEFRKIFRAIDQLEHHMQLEYGGAEFMSPQQQARHERMRDQAIQEVLDEERYQAYLLTKDPLYRQAQTLASQFGAPPSAVPSLYEMTKESERQKQQIMANQTLSPQERSRALQLIYTEQRRKAQAISLEAKQNSH